MSSIIVRDGTLADGDEVIALGKKVHAESQFKDLPYLDKYVRYTLTENLGKEGVLFLVAERDSTLVGAFAAYHNNWFFTNARYAADMFLFMDISARNTLAPVMIIQRYIDWAKKMGVARINLGQTTGIETERVVKAYQAMGFTKTGSNFTIALNK